MYIYDQLQTSTKNYSKVEIEKDTENVATRWRNASLLRGLILVSSLKLLFPLLTPTFKFTGFLKKGHRDENQQNICRASDTWVVVLGKGPVVIE